MSKPETLPDPNTPEGKIFQAAMALFLRDGKDHTAQEIADRLGWSVARVRKNLNDKNGFFAGLRSVEEQRPRYSTNYTYRQVGTYTITVYGPTREALRAHIHNMASSLTT